MYERTMSGEEDKGRWLGLVMTALAAGVVIAVLPDTMEWLLGVDFDDPEGVPGAWAGAWKQGSTALKFVGGALVVIGGIVGVVRLEWSARRPA